MLPLSLLRHLWCSSMGSRTPLALLLPVLPLPATSSAIFNASFPLLLLQLC